MKGPGGAPAGPALDGGSGTGVEVGSPLFQTVHLPARVTEVPREVVRGFSHNKRVGAYLLGRSLGEGSFAKVKEALHLPTGEKVAVKVIDKKRAKADPYVRKNLRREGRLLQQVRHKHVIHLLEVLETEHSYYLVTELCSGGDLMDYIAKRKRLDEREVKRFVRQIVSAVDYLHRLGIIHRDLKIENLLLDQNKDIKLIDFGLSNTIKVNTAPEGTAHAQEHLVTQCGSPAYAAPELLNHRKYGLQVDVWSIGVNMYAMLTGSLPFTVDPFNIKTLHNKMVTGQMNPVPENLSREGKDILRKLLTADPEQRLTIAEALRHPWLSEGRNKPVDRPPFPNKLRTSDLDTDILKHMSDNLGFRMSEVIRFVVGNVPSGASATYHLYYRKLQRHRAECRSQGKAPADTKSVEPTRISLVLQDMTTRMTNPAASAQARVAGLRARRDSLDTAAREPYVVLPPFGPRRSVDKVRTATATPSTDKDSLAGGRERTFMSSLEHSMEDFRTTADVKENNSINNNNKKGPGRGTHPYPSANTTPCTTPRPDAASLITATSPKPLSLASRAPLVSKPSHPHAGPSVLQHRVEQATQEQAAPSGGAATTRQLRIVPRSTTTATGNTAAIMISPSVSEASVQHHSAAHYVSPGGGGDSPRKGRVLVPLSRTFAPLRRGLKGAARGGTAGSSQTDRDSAPASSNHYYQQERASSHPRAEGGGGVQLIRATLPASMAYLHGTSSTPASSSANNARYTSRGGGQPLVVIKRSSNAAAAPPQVRNSIPQRAGESGAGSSANYGGGAAARLAPPQADFAKDVHSKRPVSPQALPLVRRRLAKRSRQDGLGAGTTTTHPEGCVAAAVLEGEQQEHHDLTTTMAADDGDTGIESVTVERLLTFPDCHHVSTSTTTPVVSQSEGSSVVAASWREVQQTLPAISALVTPRRH